MPLRSSSSPHALLRFPTVSPLTHHSSRPQCVLTRQTIQHTDFPCTEYLNALVLISYSRSMSHQSPNRDCLFTPARNMALEFRLIGGLLLGRLRAVYSSRFISAPGCTSQATPFSCCSPLQLAVLISTVFVELDLDTTPGSSVASDPRCCLTYIHLDRRQHLCLHLLLYLLLYLHPALCPRLLCGLRPLRPQSGAA